MEFDFNPCPDCGMEYGEFDLMPEFNRTSVYCSGNNIQMVKAYCVRCHWETGLHANVKECEIEWNNAVVYPEINAYNLSEEEIDELCMKLPEDIKYLVEIGEFTKREACSKMPDEFWYKALSNL